MRSRGHLLAPLVALSFPVACAAPGSGSGGDGDSAEVPVTGGGSGGSGSPVDPGAGGSPSSGGASSGGATTSSGGESPGTGGDGSGGAGSGTGGGGTFTAPPWPPRPTSGGPVWMRARNLCPFTLWVNSGSGGQTLSPTDIELAPGQSVDLDTPAEWPAARLTAYKEGPGAGEIEKAEMTIGSGLLNYNVTYVDWVGLPLEVVGAGGNCNDTDHATGCYAPLAELLEGCPSPLLQADGKCLSPRSYCWDESRQSEAICMHLDSAIAACTECPAGTTHQVYACNGPYSEEPRLCAALNRGMTHAPDVTDSSAYYQNPPYNEYAKWSHEKCPGIYAFSYDDWNAQGGFRSCQGDELRVTFCPGG